MWACLLPLHPSLPQGPISDAPVLEPPQYRVTPSAAQSEGEGDDGGFYQVQRESQKLVRNTSGFFVQHGAFDRPLTQRREKEARTDLTHMYVAFKI